MSKLAAAGLSRTVGTTSVRRAPAVRRRIGGRIGAQLGGDRGRPPDGRLERPGPLGPGQPGGPEPVVEPRSALADEDRRRDAFGDDRAEVGQVDRPCPVRRR